MEKIPQSAHVLQSHSPGELPIYETQPLRQLSENQVLLKVDATGIGHFQHLLLSGKTNFVTFPFVPGTNAVGHIVKAAKNGEHLVGKRVVAAGMTGMWADYTICNLYSIIPIDQDVPIESASYGFGNPITALGLIDTIKKQGKKSIVIDAAASALGRMINRLARNENIPVTNVVRTKEQEEVLKKQGFQGIVVTDQENWKSKYQNITQERQSDVLIDSLGKGEVFDFLIRGLIPGGLILIIGGLQGYNDKVKPGSTEKIEADKYTFQGWNARTWYQSITAEERNILFSLHSQRLKKELSTNVAQTFKLKDIKDAIQASKKNTTKGKIMLIP